MALPRLTPGAHYFLELSFLPLLAWENHRVQGLGFKPQLCRSLASTHQVCKALRL